MDPSVVDNLRIAIEALEAQRALLGDAVADAALAPLRQKLAEAEARAAAAEQRLKSVTVLFMDVVGSTEMIRQLDPEDVHAVMDSALDNLSAIVRAHQGRVLQYAGDSLLAVFGADHALEDDPERAVRAGLAIVAEAPRLAEQVRVQNGLGGFDLRVGIHTGPVLLGGGVDAASSIRGITVNIAARMEQTAPAGSLRISHDTFRHVRGLFEVEAQAPILIKGIADPVRSYLVLRALPRAFRVVNRGLEGVDSRMIGRERELARLTETFESVRDDRRLALITVVCDAGLGKSRLAFEFAHWLELRSEPVRAFPGRPQAYGNSVPYGLLRDLLAWRFDILDGDSQGVAKTKLANGLGPVLGERAAEQTALIGQLIGLDYQSDPHIAGIVNEAKQIRDRAFHALCEYFRLLQRQDAATLVLLLDDLQWADEGSLDFINHLAQVGQDLPLMVLGSTRPSLFERRPLWGRGQADHERIDLAPLSRRSSRELVESLLGRLDSVPVELRDLLITSAEGNPYFVEELVGMLIDDGVIVAGAGPWRVVADKLLEVHVPSTLAGVLQARIDALRPVEKTVLQQASVIGHVFWDEALSRIDPEAAKALAELAPRELISGRETSAFEGAHEFVFRHHLLHQVAYDSVLKRDKREQHRRTADWLVERSGDRASEYFGLIASHYERAGDNLDALTYLRKAAEDAAASYASHGALDYLDRALKLAPSADAATRFALLSTRCTVFSNIGRRAEQGANVAALEQLAEQSADDEMRARAGSLRASHALVTGDYRGACAAAARSVAWAEASGARAAALSARFNWARALQFQGDYASAEGHIGQSLRLARELGDRRVESTALAQLGIVAFQRGRYGAARDYYLQALAIARTLRDRAVESLAINNLGETERLLGNYEAAFRLFDAGRLACREIGQLMTHAYLLCNMAHVAFLQGRPRESIEWSDQAGEVARELKDPDLQASLLSTRGHAWSALDEPDRAAACYRQSVSIYREIGRPTMPPEPIAGLARLALARGEVAEAMKLMAEVIDHFDAGGTVEGTEDPLWIYLTCHRVLKAADSPRADDFLAQAHALLMQRAEPLAPAERATFLGNVPSHRAIVDAWGAPGRRGAATEALAAPRTDGPARQHLLS